MNLIWDLKFSEIWHNNMAWVTEYHRVSRGRVGQVVSGSGVAFAGKLRGGLCSSRWLREGRPSVEQQVEQQELLEHNQNTTRTQPVQLLFHTTSTSSTGLGNCIYNLYIYTYIYTYLYILIYTTVLDYTYLGWIRGWPYFARLLKVNFRIHSNAQIDKTWPGGFPEVVLWTPVDLDVSDARDVDDASLQSRLQRHKPCVPGLASRSGRIDHRSKIGSQNLLDTEDTQNVMVLLWCCYAIDGSLMFINVHYTWRGFPFFCKSQGWSHFEPKVCGKRLPFLTKLQPGDSHDSHDVRWWMPPLCWAALFQCVAGVVTGGFRFWTFLNMFEHSSMSSRFSGGKILKSFEIIKFFNSSCQTFGVSLQQLFRGQATSCAAVSVHVQLREARGCSFAPEAHRRLL